MKPANKIWIDGQIGPMKKANLFSFHQGLNYGACIYDGIRFYKNESKSVIFRLDDHLKRFFYSASALEMNLRISKKKLEKAIIKVIKANKFNSGYVRPIAFYSEPKMGINILGAKVTVVIFVWPWRDETEEKTITMKIVTKRRLDPKTVDLKAKIGGYYANGLLGFIEARKNGFDEPLFLDSRGFIAEGAVNNIFIAKKGVIYTPKLDNILGGITRDSIIQIARDHGFKVVEKNIRPEFLRKADEVFLTGTGIELEHVTTIDNYFSQAKITNSVFGILRDEYKKIARGKVRKYKNWLTPIK